MMKKTVSLLLMLLLLMSLADTAFAAQRIVQLTVPGCFA
jgi:hypothetical protein